MEESGNNVSSIIFRVWAVERCANSNGAETPGADGLAFKPNMPPITEEADAVAYLEPRYRNINRLLSLAKGKNDQAIRRKGIDGLTPREELRRQLKTRDNAQFLHNKRVELLRMKENPISYLEEKRNAIISHNNQLKFEICSYLRPSKIQNYKPKHVLRVYIPKSNGKMRPQGIPSILDRGLQTLLVLAMEPYMEVLGDENSFGFRPGRNCHQATSLLHSRLIRMKTRRSQGLRRALFTERRMRAILKDMKEYDHTAKLSEIDPENNITVRLPARMTGKKGPKTEVPK